MSVPKLPTDFRRDGLALITRMVRTKDLDDLQGESSPTGRFDPHHPTKLKVRFKKNIFMRFIVINTIIQV